jgi:signal transduction histidine kinase
MVEWSEFWVQLGQEAVLARSADAFRKRAARLLSAEAGERLEPVVARAVDDLAAAVHRRERSAHAERQEALARLAAGVAHDLNSLLGVIVNFAEFVAEELPPGGQAADDLEQIRHAARDAVALSERLATVAGDRRQGAESLRLQERLAGLADSLPDEVRLEVHVAGTRDVQIDRTAFDVVLANLVANACDAMPGGGLLWVHAEDEHDRVRLTVRDSGTGMDSDVAARAADPYFTTKAYGRGSGLGLATVQGLLTALGGALEIESESGAGTSVHVLLPVAVGG